MPDVRKHRPGLRQRVARAGDMVADVPEMMALWDFERNQAEAYDPTLIPAQSNLAACHWLCRKHGAGDPAGRWPAHLHRWQQSPQRRAQGGGCRFCMRKEPCPRTCFRTTNPNLVGPEVWDYKTNDARGVTPDNRFRGSHDSVSWICPRHGNYETEIRLRAVGHGCKPGGSETAREKRRSTINSRRRERWADAKRLRDTDPSEI